jgi:hypothetical protein
MGVILFRLDKDEKVVSATCITDIGEEDSDTGVEATIAENCSSEQDVAQETEKGEE